MKNSTLKKQITLCTIVLAFIVELVSLPFLGWSFLFSCGLALGTVIAIINTQILFGAVQKTVDTGNKKYIFTFKVLRLVLYGGGFVLALTISEMTGIATAICFFLPKISVFIIKGPMSKIRLWLGYDKPIRYETDETRRVFEKKPWIEMTYNGRTYKSLRRFRIVKAVRDED